MTVPLRLALEVVRDSAGRWDTRNIDYVIRVRGYDEDRPILGDLRDMERAGLIEAVPVAQGTGPCWRLTEAGTAWLADHTD